MKEIVIDYKRHRYLIKYQPFANGVFNILSMRAETGCLLKKQPEIMRRYMLNKIHEYSLY